MSQMERIAYLDRRLRERGWVTAGEVAAHFEVSPRQIKRDIEYLRWRLDAPVAYDGGRHRYIYEKPFQKLRFTDERRVLFSALVRGWAASEAFRPLVTEDLLAGVTEAVARDYRPVADRIRFEAPWTEPVDLEVFAPLCRALREGRVAAFDYEAVSGSPGPRRAEAQRLLHYGGSWYLVAFDQGRQDLRTFHLGRVRNLTVTTDPVVQAGPAWEAQVEAWVASGTGIFRGGEAFGATVRLRGTALKLARGQRWHPDQADTEGSDGGGPWVDRTVPAVDTRELVGRVLAYGADAEALAPPEFRQRWVEEVGRLAALVSNREDS